MFGWVIVQEENGTYQDERIVSKTLRIISYNSLKSYPNPVSAGSLIKIELNKAEAGEYQIDLIIYKASD